MAPMHAESPILTTVDFLGIGAQKGGTTWLYHQLARHPQVAFPRGKEVHYWDAASAPNADEWAAMLEPPSRRSRSGRPIKTGEITPAYATLPVEKIKAIHRRCPGRVEVSPHFCSRLELQLPLVPGTRQPGAGQALGTCGGVQASLISLAGASLCVSWTSRNVCALAIYPPVLHHHWLVYSLAEPPPGPGNGTTSPVLYPIV